MAKQPSRTLESYTSSEWLRRIDPANRPIRSATYVGLQPADVDGAVWIAGALSWGWQDIGSMYVTAAWVVAPFDAPPEVVGTWSVEFDPNSVADLRRAEQTVDEWASGADAAIERFAAEAERFASVSPEASSLHGAVAPELADFSLSASPDTDGRWRIDGAARIRAGTAGVAGAGYNSSPSQVRLRGSNGEMLDLMFSSAANRVSGTRIDGFYESCVWVEPYHPRGPWRVEYFLLVDQAGHSVYVYPADLESRQLPTEVWAERLQDEDALHATSGIGPDR